MLIFLSLLCLRILHLFDVGCGLWVVLGFVDFKIVLSLDLARQYLFELHFFYSFSKFNLRLVLVFFFPLKL